VIFDLFNEPFPDNNSNTAEAWRCWRTGNLHRDELPGGRDAGAGDSVRSAGATNVIMVGGVQYAATLSSWRANKPTDPRNNPRGIMAHLQLQLVRDHSVLGQHRGPGGAAGSLVLGELGQTTAGARS